jgi:hypothetical protein
MRKTIPGVLAAALLLGVGLTSRAEGPAEVGAILDKAIKAVGGEEKLAKAAKAGTWKSKGTFHDPNGPIPYTAEFAAQWPDRVRETVEATNDGTKVKIITVLDKDKGWVQQDNNTDEMSADQLKEQKEELYASWITMLLPLKDKAFTLTLLPETMVENRPALGIKVVHKDHRDVELFFDKENGLLVKRVNRAKDEDSGKELSQESFYSDYKDMDGVKQPAKTKILRDGKVYIESEDYEFKAADKLEDKLFAKP